MKILICGGAGYIGSALYKKIKHIYSIVDICDECLRGNPSGEIIKYKQNSKTLIKDIICQYDYIIWVAGCSNVPDSLKNPVRAFEKNLIELYDLSLKRKVDSKLIYISTGSLYSINSIKVIPRDESSKISSAGSNPYDISKFCFDHLAKGLIDNFIGLRIGTVCGWSPNLRPELIFNAMNDAAIYQKVVEVKNGESYRSIVFIDHLIEIIQFLLKAENKNLIKKKYLNVASCSLKINQLAKIIADFHKVKIVKLEDSKTYNFILDCKILDKWGINFKNTIEFEIKKYLKLKSEFKY